ncbi:hypothetical protein Bbelb_235290 [Branchiostoma belcheri]|nr:hypothetical protein Bbelb_235290 [Branchiostoma belcheri]
MADHIIRTECHFPFTYEGKTYNSCTNVNHDRPWCSLTADYQGEWKNCNEGVIPPSRSNHYFTEICVIRTLVEGLQNVPGEPTSGPPTSRGLLTLPPLQTLVEALGDQGGALMNASY